MQQAWVQQSLLPLPTSGCVLEMGCPATTLATAPSGPPPPGWSRRAAALRSTPPLDAMPTLAQRPTSSWGRRGRALLGVGPWRGPGGGLEPSNDQSDRQISGRVINPATMVTRPFFVCTVNGPSQPNGIQKVQSLNPQQGEVGRAREPGQNAPLPAHPLHWDKLTPGSVSHRPSHSLWH